MTNNINEIITNSPTYLTQYSQYLVSQNKSINTIKSYCKDIRLFFEHFNLSDPNIDTTIIITNPPIITITRDQILQYKQYMQNTKNNNAKTINRSLSAIKSYNEFLIVKGWQENLVVLSQDYVKIQKQLISPTNTNIKEVKMFMEKVRKNEPARNFHIVKLILNSGLRISEILNIQLFDIDFKKKNIRIIGKGSKQRIVPINNEALEVIKEAIENKKNYNHAVELNSQFLFVSNKSKTGKIESCTIERIFNKYSNTITPHKLRHCFATNFIKFGGDLEALRQILGHSSLSTTQVYLHPSQDDMRRSMNECCIK